MTHKPSVTITLPPHNSLQVFWISKCSSAWGRLAHRVWTVPSHTGLSVPTCALSWLTPILATATTKFQLCRDLRGNCSAGSSTSGIFPGHKLKYTDTSNDFPHVFEALTYNKKKTDKAVRAEQLPTFRTIETVGGGAVACLLCHQKKMKQSKSFQEIFPQWTNF